MGWNQILSLLCFLFFLHSSLPFALPLCLPDQHDALLLFKNSFVLDSEASDSCHEDDHVTSYPKTNSWNKGMDCCSWDGVTCDGVTSNVIELDLACSWLRGALHSNSSLFLLRHLRSLNLSGNNFVGSHIFSNLSAFATLTHLNLSSLAFSGTIPNKISRLSKLVSLDLSSNYISDTYSFSSLRLENSVFSMLVQNLTALRKLILDKVDMSMVSPKSFANLSSSLTYLSVDSCSLGGIFSDTVFRLPSLSTLIISYNDNMSGILPKSNWTNPLDSLYLRYTSFSGEIPDSIGTLKSLTVLDLTNCKFTGNVPSSLADLKQLQVLYIAGNSFSGILEFEIFTKLKNLRKLMVSQELNLTYNTVKYTFPNLEVLGLYSCNLTGFPYFLNSSKGLTYLDLSLNRISGEIPTWFWGVSHDTLESLDLSYNLLEGCIQQLPWKQLQYIYLQNNSFQGPLPIPSPSTSHFYASDNNFTGEIPSSICQLNSLWSLYLSNNNLSGNMPPCFGNMTNLEYLNLSGNKLQGSLPRSLVKCGNLLTLILNDNEFSDIFPHWLEAPYLRALILRSNKFHGSINLTTFGPSFPFLDYLDLSFNNFTGPWPTQVFSNTSLSAIDLSNNKFRGPIPLPSPVTFFYSIARNNIAGRIPSLICNATELEHLDLSDNGLTGSLPRCLTNFSIHLSILNMRMNHLEGTIPQSFSWRNSLSTLDLSRNRFEGTLPQSLIKCKYLEILDLSDNQIEDTFPIWFGTLPELKVLILRSNNLKDLLNIPKGPHFFPKLHILDLSNNNFSGPLPANLIMNLKSMMNGENGQDKSLYMTRSFQRVADYENSVTLSIKGQIVPLTILTVFTIIDLSHNSFQGEIPGVIGHLHSLIGLNLSHNQLTGSIPLILGNLTNLEWLDLSSNKLSGEIPRVLGDLASLGYLNLSKNQLTGRIPQDKHLSTFSSDFFSGNPGLCGTPLPKLCPGDGQPPLPSSSSSFNHKGHESWFKQKEVWIGYASGIVIGISITYIAFEMGRPKWLTRGVRMLERRAAEWIEKPKRNAIKFHG
ncbi:receptor-like protein Cf-9 homolog [Syzygium oleosum]|uniref:receptor-like protein Cf-9 homolog n=1 Tax=Syzygium oleosum TaxID=219896 RepID=UPI0024B87CE7|nr:receptor-like protein Cf-9 homolog [Syzygium oleosum]